MQINRGRKDVKRLGWLLALIACPLYSVAAPLDACQEHVKYGAPSLSGDLLCRLGYALSHNPDRKTPDWVAYHLTREGSWHSPPLG